MTSRKQQLEPQSIEPIILDSDTWLYAERGGLFIVKEERDERGRLILTSQVMIPWEGVEYALSQKPRR